MLPTKTSAEISLKQLTMSIVAAVLLQPTASACILATINAKSLCGCAHNANAEPL